MRVREMTIEEFTTAAMDELKRSKLSEVEGVADAVKSAYTEHANKVLKVAINMIKGTLQQVEKDKKSVQVTGIVIGQMERGPVLYGLFDRTIGKVVQAWRGQVDAGNKKVIVPTNCTAKLALSPTTDDFGKKIMITNVIGKKSMTMDELINFMVTKKVITGLDSARQMIHHADGTQCVAIKATVTGARANGPFGSDNKWPIWKEIYNEKHELVNEGPEISIRAKDGNTVLYATMSPGKTGNFVTPIDIEGFADLCKEAVENNSDPDDQAAYVGNGMDGIELLLICGIRSIKENNDSGIFTVNANVLMATDYNDKWGAPTVKPGQQEIEKPVEEAPTLEQEPTPENEPETVPEPAIEPEIAQEEEELTPQLKEIAERIIMAVTMTTGLRVDSPRPAKLAKIVEMPYENIRKLGLLKECGEEQIKVVYDHLVAEAKKNGN